MKIKSFLIENFRGIETLTIDLADSIPGNIVTLIGLNESGKTTVLEAISNFITEDEENRDFVNTVQEKTSRQSIIPKHKKAAFTGNTTVTATVVLTDDDVVALAEKFLPVYALELDKKALVREFKVQRCYEFTDSKYTKTNNYYNIAFPLQKKRSKKVVLYTSSGGQESEMRNIWLTGIKFIRESLPKIVYFPTFLFNFPERIYLGEFSGDRQEKQVNAYYKQILQDILDGEGSGLSIERHVLGRLLSLKAENSSISFLSLLMERDEKSQIDAVFLRLSNEISRIIYDAWNNILGKSNQGKQIQIDWQVDANQNDVPYATISLIDGQSKFSISERSLGFRWFFAFLLFTQFRIKRKNDDRTIFLFDEPAANLHSRAQIRLIESFQNIAQNNVFIIYSTHSHYMINPLWLEKAYIITNEGENQSSPAEENFYNLTNPNVKANRYRNFVSQSPEKISYFQPVLDALSIPVSPLEKASKAIIIEGKYDYFGFCYLLKLTDIQSNITIFPATGAGSMGMLINLFRGWNVDFRVILDGDPAGLKEKARYVEEFLIEDNQIKTLSELCVGKNIAVFEDLYQADVVALLKKKFNTTKQNKKLFSHLFQELLYGQKLIPLADTKKAFSPIALWIDTEFLPNK